MRVFIAVASSVFLLTCFPARSQTVVVEGIPPEAGAVLASRPATYPGLQITDTSSLALDTAFAARWAAFDPATYEEPGVLESFLRDPAVAAGADVATTLLSVRTPTGSHQVIAAWTYRSDGSGGLGFHRVYTSRTVPYTAPVAAWRAALEDLLLHRFEQRSDDHYKEVEMYTDLTGDLSIRDLLYAKWILCWDLTPGHAQCTNCCSDWRDRESNNCALLATLSGALAGLASRSGAGAAAAGGAIGYLCKDLVNRASTKCRNECAVADYLRRNPFMPFIH